MNQTLPQRRNSTNRSLVPRPTLRFSPTAWSKLLYLRDLGPTEVGCFGITEPNDLLRVIDLEVPKQVCSPVTVEFDDLAVADFFERQVELGRKPEEFARIWIHTHPGHCPQPSGTDEATFARVFGNCQWSVMFILARGGQAYARLQFNVGPAAAMLIPCEVDYSQPFAGSDLAAWELEYLASVELERDLRLAREAQEQQRLLHQELTKPVDQDERERWWLEQETCEPVDPHYPFFYGEEYGYEHGYEYCYE